MTLSRSEFVIAVPEGRQRPRLNKSSATLPPITFTPRAPFTPLNLFGPYLAGVESFFSVYSIGVKFVYDSLTG